MSEQKTSIVITAVDKTQAAFQAIGRSLGGLQSAVASVAPQFAALGAGSVAGAAVAMGVMVKRSIDAADALNDLSERTGISVRNLAGLEYAAQMSGTTLDGVAVGVRNLSRYMVENGEKLKQAGITATDANGALIQLAEQFARLEDGPKKTALALQLFGKSGTDMIPLLNQGADGVRRLMERGQELNPVTAQMAAEAGKFNDQLDELAASAKGFGIKVAGPIVTGLNQTIDNFRKAREAGLGFFQSLTGFGVRGLNESVSDAKANAGKHINELMAERDKLRARLGRGEDSYVNRQLGDVEAKLKYFRSLQLDALPSATYSNEGGRATVPESRLGVLLDAEKKMKATAQVRAPETYADKINESVAGAISGSAVVKARELADQIEALDKLFFDAGLDADIYASALDKLAGVTDKSAQETDRLAQLLDATPSAALEKTRADMQLLAEALEAGTITAVQYNEAVAARLGVVGDSIKEVDSFARDLGLTFSSAFEDAIVGGKGLSDVLKGLEQDVARIIVRKSITEPLGTAVSNATKNIDIGGFFKELFSFDGGGYTGSGARSGGVDGKGGFLSILHPQETVVDHTKGVGRVAPSVSVSITQHIDSRSDQATIVAAANFAVQEAERRIYESMRRGGKFA